MSPLLLIGVILLLGAAQGRPNASGNFDVLIFTQQWPVTTCIEWKSTNPQHQCQLPSPRELWTIHGIWPTRLGTIGPSFCNRSATFDPAQLAPFVDQLQQFWMKVERGQQLWKHEWLKHGTCAAELPALSDEHKYFGRGLSWLHQYSMSAVLAKAGIQPDAANLTAQAVHDAVVADLQVRPYVRCLEREDPVAYDDDSDTDQPVITYLSEIRICFDKQLQLVNCDGVKMDADNDYRDSDDSDEQAIDYSTVLTNCRADRAITYPGVVPPSWLLAAEQYPAATPPLTVASDAGSWRFPWLDVYKLLSLIRAATL